MFDYLKRKMEETFLKRVEKLENIGFKHKFISNYSKYK